MNNDLTWLGNHVPYSLRFEDTYFSKTDGLAESRYVFLQGIGFTELMHKLRYIVIGELGFGTGLNFIATWQAFIENSAADQYLHFISIEKYPLTTHDLSLIAKRWPELDGHYRELIRQYPSALPGCHRLFFAQGRITLDLWFGDAAHILPELPTATIHAWHLDGFAPARNPELWQMALLAEVTRCTSPGGRFATFTVAGQVRRNLADCGLIVKKREGFAQKRHCLIALKAGEITQSLPQHVQIYGTGIAGCTLAYSLARKGVSVSLHDRSKTFSTQGASSVPCALLNPKFVLDNSHYSCFYPAAYLFAVREYNNLDAPIWIGERGILNIAYEDTRLARYQKLLSQPLFPADTHKLLSPQEASQLSHIPINAPALYWPQAGCLDSQQTCSAFANTITYTQKILPLTQPDFDIHQNSITVLCIGAWLKLYSPTLPIALNRGQVNYFTNTDKAPLRATTATGYITPENQNGLFISGSTYERNANFNPGWTNPSRTNTQELISKLKPFFPDANHLSNNAWVGMRATTQNKLPVLGQLREPCYYFTGLGSHGFLFAPLCAEILASHLLHIPPPCTRQMLQRLGFVT